MKVKVVEMFRDKYTNDIYNLNDVIEVNDKRYKEIERYVEVIKEKAKKDNKNSK